MKRPSFQFYPGDWLNDAALRTCSVGARGLWIDMLCFMHQGSEYGYLKVNHKVILIPNLARMVGSTLDEIVVWVEELESAGVFSKDANGCVFSRRMIRDEKIRESRACGGILGGNPALKKVNHASNLKPTPSSSSSPSSSLAEREYPEISKMAKPPLKEVLSRAQLIGLAEWKAQDWFEEMEGCGWHDHNKRPIQSWQSILNRVRTKWESDGRPMSPPKPYGAHNGNKINSLNPAADRRNAGTIKGTTDYGEAGRRKQERQNLERLAQEGIKNESPPSTT